MAFDFKLYLCFCAEFYTGESKGEWYQTMPPSVLPSLEERNADDKPEGYRYPQCHRWDDCGFYTVERVPDDNEV